MRHLNKKIWPYQISLKIPETSGVFMDASRPQFPETASIWCTRRIGKRGTTWYSYITYEKCVVFAFKEEGDMLAFKLTWRQNGN